MKFCPFFYLRLFFLHMKTHIFRKYWGWGGLCPGIGYKMFPRKKIHVFFFIFFTNCSKKIRKVWYWKSLKFCMHVNVGYFKTLQRKNWSRALLRIQNASIFRKNMCLYSALNLVKWQYFQHNLQWKQLLR